METTTVTRWRRYGKDRLYATDAAGVKIGWVDLLSGHHHPESPERAAELAVAVAAWQLTSTLEPQPGPAKTATGDLSEAPAANTSPAAAPSVAIPPPLPYDDVQTLASEVPEQPGWEDLSDRRAGAMARQQAVALKQAAPVRTFLARAFGVHTDERAWRIGADGEEKVAAQLVQLASKDPRWQFLHAVPVGENGSDIDHVAVGPGGVFTLNAKHHPGAKIWVGGNTLLVNGQRQALLRNSAHEARRTARLLTAACGFPVTAVGVVVPVGATDVVIKSPPTDVHVINRRALAQRLRHRPPTLSDDAVTAIFTAARRSTTWQTQGR